MAKPVPGLDELYAEFRGEKTFRVPVIRIFGVSELGEFTLPPSLSLFSLILFDFQERNHVFMSMEYILTLAYHSILRSSQTRLPFLGN